MKLKQRVIVIVVLFVGTATYLLVSLLATSEITPSPPRIVGQFYKARSYYHASVEPAVVRFNRSRDHVLSRPGQRNDQVVQEEGGTRRLQQKQDLNGAEDLEKQPRGPETVDKPLQKDTLRRPNADDPAPSNGKEVVNGEVVERVQNAGKEEEEEEEGGGVERQDPWRVWQSWVKPDYFYPKEAFWSEEMNSILNAMATYPITSFDIGHKGTQLKASMFLGEQQTLFKPMRYPRDEVIGGDPYAGFDRHNAEIAGFHLDALLGFRIAPPVVGRRINLTALWPVTTQPLRDTYFNDKDGNTCFYGKCYYCRREEAACGEGGVMEGSVTLWLPDWYQLKTRRHPYQRTYRPHQKAKWEVDDSYCSRHIISKPESEFYHGLLEYTDSCIFDFLMGNADRHHYETYSKVNNSQHGKLLHIDNGKSFGNPHHDEMSILAPLKQCCRVRRSTWDHLQDFISSVTPLSEKLNRSMRRDPVYPILTPLHLEAIDRRLSIIDRTVRDCFLSHGRDTVLCDRWPPDNNNNNNNTS